MDGIIQFETAPRPLTRGKSKFPYSEALRSMAALKSEESLAFPREECTAYHCFTLNKLAQKENLGEVRHCLNGKKRYVWLHEGRS